MSIMQRAWLSGALLVKASATTLDLGLVTRAPSDYLVSVQALGWNRRELDSAETTRHEFHLTTSLEEASFNSAHTELAGDVLGGSAHCYGGGQWSMSAKVMERASYFAFSMRKSKPSRCRRRRSDRWKRKPQTIHLELSQHSLRKTGYTDSPQLFLLLTRAQAEKRILAIAKQFELLSQDSEYADIALTNLYISLLSGRVSPLLTEPI